MFDIPKPSALGSIIVIMHNALPVLRWHNGVTKETYVMARIWRQTKRRDDIRHNHDDFYEAIPYQQQLIREEAYSAEAERDYVTPIIRVVLYAVEALLAMRLLLQALGTSTAYAFADFIYAVSYPLVRPFVGMFYTPLDGVAGFSTATLVAMFVYLVVGVLLIALVRAVHGDEIED